MAALCPACARALAERDASILEFLGLVEADIPPLTLAAIRAKLGGPIA